MKPSDDEEEPLSLPIDGTLDLHTFAPRDAASVVEEYLEEACRGGLASVRIVHGKGIGVLRRIVHGVLDRRTDLVARYGNGGSLGGGWGATVAFLRPRDNRPRSE